MTYRKHLESNRSRINVSSLLLSLLKPGWTCQGWAAPADQVVPARGTGVSRGLTLQNFWGHRLLSSFFSLLFKITCLFPVSPTTSLLGSGPWMLLWPVCCGPPGPSRRMLHTARVCWVNHCRTQGPHIGIECRRWCESSLATSATTRGPRHLAALPDGIASKVVCSEVCKTEWKCCEKRHSCRISCTRSFQ